MSYQAQEAVLIIPVYNPEDGWVEVLLNGHAQFNRQLGFVIPLIVVNDGSISAIETDLQILRGHSKALPIQIISYVQNIGKGGALKRGAALLDRKYYIFTDFDFPYTTDSMVAVYQALVTHGGITPGHRRESYYTDLSNLRTVISKGLRWLNKIILGLPTPDTQCGLKGFDREGRDLLVACNTDRFLIDLEFLLAANKNGVKITPIDVMLRPDVEFTKFNPMILAKELLNFAKLIWQYRIRV
jgi:glycosyltransferase involved in cell wall biosynthesis